MSTSPLSRPAATEPAQSGCTSKLLPIFVACAVAFVWLTSRSLPPIVASHFGATGVANGFMPRDAYVWFVSGIVVLLPLIIVYVPNRVLTRSSAVLNLPNRDYWLAPERRAETVAFLCRFSTRFGYVLVGFLAYVHWLVVRANAVTPPGLNARWFVVGLVAFVGLALVSVLGLLRRFGRVPTD